MKEEAFCVTTFQSSFCSSFEMSLPGACSAGRSTEVVSTKDGHSATANPVQLISQLCQPEDFCVARP